MAKTKSQSARPISDTIRRTIKQRRLTAYRVAKLSGCAVDPVSRFLKRQRGLTLDTVDLLAKGLGLTLVETDEARSIVATASPPSPYLGKLVGINDASRILGVDRWTARRMHRRGELPPPIALFGSHPLWTPDAIERHASDRRITPKLTVGN